MLQWAVPQLAIMIIYNSSWSVLIQEIRVMIVRWQSDLVKQNKAIFLYGNNNKRKVQKRNEIVKFQGNVNNKDNPTQA